MLENRDVDAVTIAAPDHWHALMTIWACQAGKDVYCEKPISHNIAEGRRMIEAARRHNRVVAVGTQRRSGAVLAKAVQFLRDGGLGTIHSGRTDHPSSARSDRRRGEQPRAAGVDYDLWLGPAPARPFNENHFHYHWHWFWEYGTTDLGNTGVHSLDAVRWLVGKQEHPRPRTARVDCSRPGRQPIRRRRIRNMRPTIRRRHRDPLRPAELVRRPAEAAGVFVFGSKGWMKVGDDKAEVYLGRKNEPGTLTADGKGTPARSHFQNFIDCVRSRKSDGLKAAHRGRASLDPLCHLGNISYRVKRSVQFDGATERFVGDEEADKLLGTRMSAAGGLVSAGSRRHVCDRIRPIDGPGVRESGDRRCPPGGRCAARAALPSRRHGATRRRS